MKKHYLARERGLAQKSIYPLEGLMTIGRSSQNDITLMDWTVSRTHARLSFSKNAWFIEDLGSANGIIFDGERVAKRLLQPGDKFQIGESTLYLIQEDVAADAQHLSDTMKTFAGITKYQSPLLERSHTSSGLMSLQETLLMTQMFNSLGETDFKELDALANLHLFSASQIVIREGDPGRSTYVILEGRIKVFTKDYAGNEVRLATLGANQFFGEISLLTGEPRSSSVATIEESLLSELSYKNMRKIMLRYPRIKEVMFSYFGKRTEDSRKKRAVAGPQDRRRQPRLNERLMASFTVWPSESLPEEMISHTYQGSSSDISLDGTKLAVMGPAMDAFSPGCQLQLQIVLPQPWGTFYTLGKISRVISGKLTVQLGIEFSGISSSEYEKLKDFIYGEVHTT